MQFTPSGSRCSVATGTGITPARRVQLGACASSRLAPSALRPPAASAPGSPPPAAGSAMACWSVCPRHSWAGRPGDPPMSAAQFCPGRAGLGADRAGANT